MTPYEQVEELYRLYPQARTLWDDIRWHSESGYYAYITPRFMVLAWPFCDTWIINAIAGDMLAAWQALPFELPQIAFYRPKRDANVLQIYPLARFRRLCHASLSAGAKVR